MVSGRIVTAAYVAAILLGVDAGVCHPGTRTSLGPGTRTYLSQLSSSSATSALSGDPTESRSSVSETETSQTSVDDASSSSSYTYTYSHSNSYSSYNPSSIHSASWSQPTVVTSGSQTSVSGSSTSITVDPSQSRATSGTVSSDNSQIDPVTQSSTSQATSATGTASSQGPSSSGSVSSQSTALSGDPQSGSTISGSQTASSGSISADTSISSGTASQSSSSATSTPAGSLTSTSNSIGVTGSTSTGTASQPTGSQSSVSGSQSSSSTSSSISIGQTTSLGKTDSSTTTSSQSSISPGSTTTNSASVSGSSSGTSASASLSSTTPSQSGSNTVSTSSTTTSSSASGCTPGTENRLDNPSFESTANDEYAWKDRNFDDVHIQTGPDRAHDGNNYLAVSVSMHGENGAPQTWIDKRIKTPLKKDQLYLFKYSWAPGQRNCPKPWSISFSLGDKYIGGVYVPGTSTTSFVYREDAFTFTAGQSSDLTILALCDDFNSQEVLDFLLDDFSITEACEPITLPTPSSSTTSSSTPTPTPNGPQDVPCGDNYITNPGFEDSASDERPWEFDSPSHIESDQSKAFAGESYLVLDATNGDTALWKHFHNVIVGKSYVVKYHWALSSEHEGLGCKAKTLLINGASYELVSSNVLTIGIDTPLAQYEEQEFVFTAPHVNVYLGLIFSCMEDTPARRAELLVDDFSLVDYDCAVDPPPKTPTPTPSSGLSSTTPTPSPTSSPSQCLNLLPNGDFEGGDAWTGIQFDPVQTQSDDPNDGMPRAHSGSSYLLLRSPGNPGAYHTLSGLESGKQYKLKYFWAFADTQSATCTIKTLVTTQTSMNAPRDEFPLPAGAANDYQEHTWTFTLPDLEGGGSQYVVLILDCDSGDGPFIQQVDILVDDVSIVESPCGQTVSTPTPVNPVTPVNPTTTPTPVNPTTTPTPVNPITTSSTVRSPVNSPINTPSTTPRNTPINTLSTTRTTPRNSPINTPINTPSPTPDNPVETPVCDSSDLIVDGSFENLGPDWRQGGYSHGGYACYDINTPAKEGGCVFFLSVIYSSENEASSLAQIEYVFQDVPDVKANKAYELKYNYGVSRLNGVTSCTLQARVRDVVVDTVDITPVQNGILPRVVAGFQWIERSVEVTLPEVDAFTAVEFKAFCKGPDSNVDASFTLDEVSFKGSCGTKPSPSPSPTPSPTPTPDPEPVYCNNLVYDPSLEIEGAKTGSKGPNAWSIPQLANGYVVYQMQSDNVQLNQPHANQGKYYLQANMDYMGYDVEFSSKLPQALTANEEYTLKFHWAANSVTETCTWWINLDYQALFGQDVERTKGPFEYHEFTLDFTALHAGETLDFVIACPDETPVIFLDDFSIVKRAEQATCVIAPVDGSGSTPGGGGTGGGTPAVVNLLDNPSLEDPETDGNRWHGYISDVEVGTVESTTSGPQAHGEGSHYLSVPISSTSRVNFFDRPLSPTVFAKNTAYVVSFYYSASEPVIPRDCNLLVQFGDQPLAMTLAPENDVPYQYNFYQNTFTSTSDVTALGAQIACTTMANTIYIQLDDFSITLDTSGTTGGN